MARVDKSEVLSFTVFKQEPECLTYTVRVTAEYEMHQPEYLEQLHVLSGVLNAHREKSEQDNLQARINQYREVRAAIAEEREARSADSGPTGGEPESSGTPEPDGDSSEEGEA
jgi:hypothetical protein